jgi:hypothetical protein
MPVHSDHKYAVLYLMEAEGTKKDNIKMDLKEIRYKLVYCIHLVQNRNQ